MNKIFGKSNSTGKADIGMITMKAVHEVVGIIWSAMWSTIKQNVKYSHSEYYPSPAEIHENHNALIPEELPTLIRCIVDDKAFSDANTKFLPSKEMQSKCI